MKQFFSNEHVIKALELIFGVIVGVLTWKLTNESQEISSLLGILIGLIASLITIILIEFSQQLKNITSLNESYKNLIHMVNDSQNQNIMDINTILKYGIVTFTNKNMPNVWRNLLWGVQKTYYTTNYIKYDDFYNNSWAEAALSIQKAKINGEDVLVKKVFIIDDDSEKEQLKITLEEQSAIGALVRYIYKKDIDKNPTLKLLLDDLESIDFGLFDTNKVFLWKLKNRKAVSSTILFTESECEKYKLFFEQLYNEAKNPNSKNIIDI